MSPRPDLCAHQHVAQQTFPRLAQHHLVAVAIGHIADDETRYRQPLPLVAVEKSGTGGAFGDAGEFPAEIVDILQTGVESQSADRSHQVGGVAEEEGAPDAEMVGVSVVDVVAALREDAEPLASAERE